MGLEVVASRDAEIETDKQAILEMLERAVEQIKTDEIEPNRMLLLLVSHDVESFVVNTRYQGRALEMMGILETAKEALLEDMGFRA